MARVAVDGDLALNVEVADYLWPWTKTTPVLMQHGFSRNASFWRKWVPILSETRRVYRPDVRGCGKSDLPPEGFTLTPEMQAADHLRVLDELGIDKVHWVGESSGGVLGINFAATYPDRVASLTLVNTPLRVSVPKERVAAEGAQDVYSFDTASPAAAIEKYGVEEWSRRTLAQALDVELASKELQDFYVTEKGKTPGYVATTYLGSVQTIDTVPLLRGLKIPVLLLAGDKRQATVEQLRGMEREIAHVRVRIFEGYGKAIHVLIPERCAHEATAFWESFDPSGQTT